MPWPYVINNGSLNYICKGLLAVAARQASFTASI